MKPKKFMERTQYFTHKRNQGMHQVYDAHIIDDHHHHYEVVVDKKVYNQLYLQGNDYVTFSSATIKYFLCAIHKKRMANT